ncbi:MAG: hypothetical protein VX593_00495 [Pseudomonadota bacterium]|nr:hypothetical protein [Pseudomonadota bacterium]
MSDQPSHSVPIDAEYEPADTPQDDTPETTKEKRGGGPGWIAWAFLLLIALGSAGLSVWSSGLLGKTGLLDDTPAVADTSDALRADQEALEARVSDLSAQIERTADRIDTEIARLEEQMEELVSAAPAGDNESAALPAEVEARLSGLESQLETLSADTQEPIDPARLDAIERALANSQSDTGASDAQIVSLRTELETLRSEIATLEATQRDFATELDNVRNDSAEIRKQSTSAVSASLALAAIEAAANRGETFETEYQQLRDARPDDSAVDALSSLARIEVPTTARLRADFRSLRNNALTRDTEEASGMGWVSTVFGDSVSIRRTSSDSETADRLADAEAALARDDLDEAIDAVEALPDTTRPIFQTWLADAQRRARLEGSLEELRLKLIAAGQ